MVMFLTSLWLMVCLGYFLPFVLLLPVACIPKFGQTWYRHLSGYWDHFGRLSVMCIPFSWCMPPLRIKDYVRAHAVEPNPAKHLMICA